MSKYKTKSIADYSQKFAALSNPNRAEIFLRLAAGCCGVEQGCNREELRTCVGELGKHLHIAASTMSHHLKELHYAGLIKMERHGRTVRCWVDPETVTELAEFFRGAIDRNQKMLIRT